MYIPSHDRVAILLLLLCHFGCDRQVLQRLGECAWLAGGSRPGRQLMLADRAYGSAARDGVVVRRRAAFAVPEQCAVAARLRSGDGGWSGLGRQQTRVLRVRQCRPAKGSRAD
jgi:hypothetical protein